MVHLMTGRDSLDYNAYGNYCGIGGGDTPVDNIDRYRSVSSSFNYAIDVNIIFTQSTYSVKVSNTKHHAKHKQVKHHEAQFIIC